MINKKIKGLIKETDGGLGREFFPCGAAIWIPAALFVLLVLFQMIPLPAGVLKVVSPATYELYEEILPEVGGRLATDPHRPTQTFVRRTPDKQATRLTGQASPAKNSHRFAKRQKSEVREKDEHRTSNTRLPCITNDGGMIIVTGPRHQDILPRPPKGIAGRSNIQHPTSNEKMKLRAEERGKDEHRTSNTSLAGESGQVERPTSNGKMKLKSEVRKQKTENKNTGILDKETGKRGLEREKRKLEWRCISINRHGTLRMLLKFLAYVGVFFIVLYFNPSGQKGNGQEKSSVSVRPRNGVVPDFIFGLIWLIFFLGLFNAFFSFLQEVSGGQIQWLRPLAPPGIYLGTFKSPNNFSEFLEMVIPLTMGLLIVQNYAEVKRFSQRLGAKTARMAALFSKTGLLSFGIIILIPALFFSLCRGGFVTFPVTMVITLIFMVVSYRLHDRHSFVLFGFVVAGGFAYLIWMGAGPVIKEAMTIFSPGSRLFTYSDAIDIIKDFPLFGVGFGDWHDIIMKYNTIIGRETWMPAIAYNDTLQITVETGFAGLACVATFLFMIYRKAINALRRGGDVVSQALILGGITAMSAALIHCQFDYLFYLPSNAVVFMVIAGMTYRLSNYEL